MGKGYGQLKTPKRKLYRPVIVPKGMFTHTRNKEIQQKSARMCLEQVLGACQRRTTAVTTERDEGLPGSSGWSSCD